MKKSSLKAVLNMSHLGIAAKINRARLIVQAIDSNPNTFTNPVPALAGVYQAIDELEAAFTDASDGGKTKTRLMYDKEDALMLLMNELTAYVQMVAAGDEGIVHLAGLEVKGFSHRNARDYSVEQGDHSGSVVVTAPFLRRAAYLWEYTNDPSGNWISAGDTLTSSIEINNLVPGTRYWFRVAIIDSTGRHPFNAPLSLIAL